MASSRDSAAAHQGGEDAKSSDEFVSIEEADEEKHNMLKLTVGGCGLRRQRQQEAAAGNSSCSRHGGSSQFQRPEQEEGGGVGEEQAQMAVNLKEY